jgi:hypothetical protein
MFVKVYEGSVDDRSCDEGLWCLYFRRMRIQDCEHYNDIDFVFIAIWLMKVRSTRLTFEFPQYSSPRSPSVYCCL